MAGPAPKKPGKADRETSLWMFLINTEAYRAMQEEPGVEIMLMYRFTFINIVE